MAALFSRILKTSFGLLLIAAGCYLILRANIGLDPWSALSYGLSAKTGLSFGAITVLTSLTLLVIALLLGEKIGAGTLLDSFLIGPFIDFFIRLDFLPVINHLVLGVLIVLIGLIFISAGIYFYMRTSLGCGPRDSLMIALGKRLPKLPIGLVRSCIEGAVLLSGWLLGAKVGLGTVICVLGIGIILQAVFKIFRFDAKSIVHEDIVTSLKNVLRKKETTGLRG